MTIYETIRCLLVGAGKRLSDASVNATNVELPERIFILDRGSPQAGVA
jgi:hypothetical protein